MEIRDPYQLAVTMTYNQILAMMELDIKLDATQIPFWTQVLHLKFNQFQYHLNNFKKITQNNQNSDLALLTAQIQNLENYINKSLIPNYQTLQNELSRLWLIVNANNTNSTTNNTNSTTNNTNSTTNNTNSTANSRQSATDSSILLTTWEMLWVNSDEATRQQVLDRLNQQQ